jgi:hypothetical protein
MLLGIMQKRIRIDTEKVKEISARIILSALKKHVQRVRAAEIIQKHVIHFLYGKVFASEEYFNRVVVPDVTSGNVYPSVNYANV